MKPEKFKISDERVKKIKCGLCGYDMTIKGETTIPLLINVSKGLTEYEKKEYKRVKKMFGKTRFPICICCLIKSLGFDETVVKK